MSSLQPKTMTIINKANEIISQYDIALTIRQIYYRFVGEGLIENSLKSYKNLAGVLAKAREEGLIDFENIIDRTRQVYQPNSWSSPLDFFETVKGAYRRDLLNDQLNYIEVWVEKDALTGVFEPITKRYCVPLVVGRGYPSHSALFKAFQRIDDANDKTSIILYFGDFDPSGEDISRDIQDRLETLFNILPSFEKVSLTRDDIQKYNLPPAPAKKTDSRTKAFVKAHGNITVELDALPPDILTQKVESSIKEYLDLTKFKKQQDLEEQDKQRIELLTEGMMIE